MAADKNDTDSKTQQVYQLSYIEREPGVDDYEVTMLVSDRFIRVDEQDEASGYIVYDDHDKIIYSVSHFDKSVLVIKEHRFAEKDSPVKPVVEYLQLADAPSVSGSEIYNYRVYMDDGKGAAESEETCTEIQLVENLLPEVRKILHNYQKVVSGQQVKMTDNKITDVHDACFYADQVYNAGAYYDKGMPIQEWHSNERSKILTSYKKIAVATDKFIIPKDYRQFSVDKDSKRPLE
jgi:predicted GTPase